MTDGACKSNGIYVLGDARRGPATVVEAIADAAAAARDILGAPEAGRTALRLAPAALKVRRSALKGAGSPSEEAARCLGCETVCENCVDVCPNRANIAVKVPGFEKEQVVHVDKMCNECGNCAVFCPYISAPYKDKFTLFASAGDMADSANAGFCVLDAGAQLVKVRLGGEEYETELASDTRTDASIRALMQAVIRDYAYCL